VFGGTDLQLSKLTELLWPNQTENFKAFVLLELLHTQD
jgi:hypothetical protein